MGFDLGLSTCELKSKINSDNPLGAAYNAGVTREKLQFTYDYMGRRIQKTFSQWDADNAAFKEVYAKLFIYDGWNLVAERTTRDGATSTQTYLWGTDLSGTPQGAGGVGGLLAATDANGSTFFPTYDGNGNVMGYFNANGASVAEYDYGPFGEPVKSTGPKANEFPFRFSTKYQDEETGQLYYGYRLYDPPSGKWLSRDPIEEQGGINLYGFVDNDAVNSFDYLGQRKLASKIHGTLLFRLSINAYWWLRDSLDPDDLYIYNDDLNEMSPYLDGEIGSAISNYAEKNNLKGWIDLNDLGLKKHRRTGGNFRYTEDRESPLGTGWWLHGAAPDVYATGRICIDDSTRPNGVYVNELDMVWADRIDPNENSDIWQERLLHDLTANSRVWFNIEINWTIEKGLFYP